jgi:rhodanese-related sulfurtransferase
VATGKGRFQVLLQSAAQRGTLLTTIVIGGTGENGSLKGKLTAQSALTVWRSVMTLMNVVGAKPTQQSKPRFSAVLEAPPADPDVARRHFLSRLAFETDVSDLMADLNKGNSDLVVVDTRSPKSYALCRIPGAINLPKITAATTGELPKDKVYVVYCWGPGCNGSTKGALALNELGFRAKELIGGIEYWRKEGGSVDGTVGKDAPMYWAVGA